MPIPWHRIFGMALTQYFAGSAWQVEVEVDLSLALPQGPGAYDVLWGTETIRILVLREMLEGEQNLVWNLFSNDTERVATAFRRLQPRLQSWSSLLNQLLEYYDLEGMAMPYPMEDFERDAAESVLKKLTPEQVLKTIPPEELLAHLSLEQRLKGLSFEEVQDYFKKHKPAKDDDAPHDHETPH